MTCRDEWHATVTARSASERETICCSDQLWKRDVAVILSCSECLRMLEEYVLPFKVSSGSPWSLFCVLHALTTIDWLTPWGISLGQPWENSSCAGIFFSTCFTQSQYLSMTLKRTWVLSIVLTTGGRSACPSLLKLRDWSQDCVPPWRAILSPGCFEFGAFLHFSTKQS